MCRVHKPRVPNGHASQQKLGPADDIANDAQLLGRPKKPNDRTEGRSSLRLEGAFDSGPPLRPEGLAKEDQRSLPTPVRLSDRKAWPNTASEL